ILTFVLEAEKRFLIPLKGQCERHCCPLLANAGEGEPAFMSSRDAPVNRESEACASCLARAGLVHPVKAFAQVRQVFGGNADPCVTYLQERLVISRRREQGNTTTGSVIFDGIVEYHQQSLFQQQRIP